MDFRQLPSILDATDENVEELFQDKAFIARQEIEKIREKVYSGECTYGFAYQYDIDTVTDDYRFIDKKFVIDDIIFHLNRSQSMFCNCNRSYLQRMDIRQLNALLRWMVIEETVQSRYATLLRQKERGDIKFAKTSVKTLTNQYEKIGKVWNEVLDDDIMTPEELRRLVDTVHKCKIYHDDFYEFEQFAVTVLLKSRVDYDDSVKIYDLVVKIMECITQRIEYKRKEEQNALSQTKQGEQT